MLRVLYSSSLRAKSPIARVNVLPKPALLFRTIVTKKYTEDHEWISYDPDTKIGTVSITNHAQQQLGDVVFVEIKDVGTEVAKGDSLGAVESVKAASDIYAPVSGKIKDINPTLGSEPGLLNSSPEGDGWLCKIELSDPSEIDQLLSAEEYKAFCENSSGH